MAKILLIEDDQDLTFMLRAALLGEHHMVDHHPGGADALEHMIVGSYDVIVLDWELPEISGIDICSDYRKKGGRTPILMLTGKSSVKDKTKGLDSGADDYLSKPFDPSELSARLRALLRRPANFRDNIFRIRDIELDPRRHRVTKNGKYVELQPKEFALLEYLMRNMDQVSTIDHLIVHIWSADSATEEAVRTTIKRLRKKLDENAQTSLIRTVHSVGYIIDSVEDS